ncbi:MAG: UDP-N-acetylmuramoyl-L-alanyl-D-glutamate--2,6-diaminopimelate ligase [Parcubacteria group bacterium Gr01-1014_38]|nr:MAG: UDP-N-acetylmuramoyl-L-alanyl-D-glutamate--2,6-diaminopimelate ligase [Parcubacteria group bacterium Gr01-1014_38]
MWTVKRRLLRVWKTTQAFVASVIWGFPGRKLRVVGVTGTDGKTTTVHLIVKALESAGYTVGAVSTIRYQVGTRVWTNTSKLTTPGPWELQKLLAHMIRAGCHYVVLECSSHRLDQGGLWGIPFDVAVITNITREHFDYHRNFDDYARAKRRLFMALHHPPKILPFRSGIDRGGRVPTVAVANLDDERARGMLTEMAERRYGFTVGGTTNPERLAAELNLAILTAQSVGGTPSGFPGTIPPPLYLVRAGEEEALLRVQLPGRVNLANALAAIAVGIALDIPLAQLTRELSEVDRIPGRMDTVAVRQPFTVLVDYAVTPAAFSALYEELGKWKAPQAQLLHVFGAAGERDRGKRPLLGELAGKHADLVILTDEDPYQEDPEQILRDLEAGVVAAGKIRGESLLRIRDRRLAIREALRRARPGDIVLVTGKGAEETMAVGQRRIPWNDRAVITEELHVRSDA